MIGTIVEGARIYDGISATPRETDLAIVGDRIALVGDLSEREALERIDGRGRCLTPGFIDVHSHSDELWLVDGRCEGKILQGVTTEIAGNCGTSVAPLRGLALERKLEDVRRYGFALEWDDLDTFFTLVERSGVALNVATLAGLGTIRRAVRGDLAGPLEEAEAKAARALVREAVDHGALGVSSGLVYTPGRFADTAELVALCAAAREAGAPRYATHLRDEGDRSIEAVEEALEIGRSAEVAVQCSHHKAWGKKNWGKVHRSLELIARARQSGLPCAADVYPYVAAQTELATILPAQFASGGREATLARLRDPEIALALSLRLELERGDAWHDILISYAGSGRNEEFAGERLDEIARRKRRKPARAAIDLLIEEKLDVEAIFFAMCEDDVATVLSAEFSAIGSDASARALDGRTARGVPHPRTFGTFPRVFGRFVRGRKTLELAEAIRRMTSLPAELFGLAGRGRIVPGAFADLVLFDAETIVDTATYERPYAYPRGIDGVWVNGRAVARDGKPTGERPGRALRGGRASLG